MPKCLNPNCSNTTGAAQLYCTPVCQEIKWAIDENERLARQLSEEQEYHDVFQDKAHRIGGRMKNSFRGE